MWVPKIAFVQPNSIQKGENLSTLFDAVLKKKSTWDGMCFHTGGIPEVRPYEVRLVALQKKNICFLFHDYAQTLPKSYFP